MANTPPRETHTDDGDQQLEKHVIEIMGPPQLFDGSKPQSPATSQPDEMKREDTVDAPESGTDDDAKTAQITAALGSLDNSENNQSTSEPKSSSLFAGDDGIKAEGDLDMEQLPSDFRATTAPEDAETAAAVEDILHSDSDAALAAVPHEKAIVMKPSLPEQLKNGWYNWWYSPWKRYGTLGFLVVVCALVFFVAPLRALVLNTVGVRSSVLVRTVDKSTNLPLQNVVVKVDGLSGKTNNNGELRLTGIRLGKHDVMIGKTAFATVEKKQVQFGMRIIDLGEVALKPTGLQITYNFTDYLSGKAIAGVELSSGEATAKSDKKGKAILTTLASSSEKVTVKKDGYRTEVFEGVNEEQVSIAQKLVPSARAIFISKESGKYDVYKVYLDGRNREVLLAGTGLETQAMTALPKPGSEKVAVVSSRDDKRNKDGFLLTGLNVVDTESGDTVNIDYAEQITLLGWRGDTLLYSQTVAGVSAANPNRQKIIAYDFSANKRFQLANANYFAGIQLAGKTVYYTVSSTDPSAQSTFVRVGIDGTAKKTLYTGNLWSLLRTDYTKMKLQTPDKWYEYTVGASAAVESTPVADYGSRFYEDDPTGASAAWVDVRDNKGVLLLRSTRDGTDKTLVTQKNMQVPSYWLNSSTVVYRVSGPTEVADYAISIDGGVAKKISEVSLTSVR
ncbi:MAG: hypothetical protein WAW63_01315 [Candidatus Saccharimonadales bacterium]